MTGIARKALLLKALVAALVKVQDDGHPQYCRTIVNRMEVINDRYGWGN